VSAKRRRLAVVLGAAAALLFYGIAGAQTPGARSGGAANSGLGTAFGNSDQPVEIYADQGIEWHQDASAYVARGNARAIRGETTVYGDTLIAYYRKAPARTAGSGSNGATNGDLGSGTQIYRVDADGNVRIVSPNGTAYGDHAVYDVDKAILVMRGKNLRLVTDRDTITARDTLEYWQNQDMAVARGNALAVSDDRKISANILTAYFRDENGRDEHGKASAPKGSKSPASPAAKGPKPASGAKAAPGADSNLDRMYAYGNVVITTPQEVAMGNRGVYNARTGIAVLTGAVKITRDKNQLNGAAAEINLNTNVSRMLAAPGEASAPVRALLVPGNKNGGGTGEASGTTAPPGGTKP
jgi:lipopolysaccharide export system protein LptA